MYPVRHTRSVSQIEQPFGLAFFSGFRLLSENRAAEILIQTILNPECRRIFRGGAIPAKKAIFPTN
jgi:hypothetical protein